MIKAAGRGKKGNLVILGLSDRNLEKLRAGLPILVDLNELGSTGELMIMWGPTEDDIARQLASVAKLPV